MCSVTGIGDGQGDRSDRGTLPYGEEEGRQGVGVWRGVAGVGGYACLEDRVPS